MRRQSSKESGFTLVLGLVFVLVSSMSAVMLMRGTAMQEQMTSNMNNKAISFMAAEAGANKLRASLVGNWPMDSVALNALKVSGGVGSSGRYLVSSISGGGFNPVVAKITGSAVQGSHLLGVTTIEATFGRVSLNLPAALTLTGSVASFNGGNSSNFLVAGGGVSAIATQNILSNQTVIAGIPVNRYGSYSAGACTTTPCVEVKDLGAPWNDAGQLMAFVDSIKNYTDVAYHQGDWANKSLDNAKPITIVSGDMQLGGNQTDYKGVIIVLGGDFTIKGGGSTKISGAVYVANVVAGSTGSWAFDKTTADISGGGTVQIGYDDSMGSSVLLPTVLGWRETI